jgi:aryl-alcohol dehydrogenase-like predicted oxidoreductase
MNATKIALGTAQFGLDYGITNQNGQVSIIEVENILQMAEGGGIDTLDTASAYGNSEEVLGRVGVDNFQVVTKTTSLNGGVNEVIKRFYQSLNNLNKANVGGLLIHDIDEVNYKQFDSLFSRLNELKKEGLVNKIGFSTYTPGQVDLLLKNFDFDLIQVPFNVFDNRLIQGGQLKALNNRGIEIHARSVFLQGLLLNFKNLPGYFSRWKNQFSEYQDTVEKSGLSLLEYALNFALNAQEIDKVLVGVNSEQQLKEIVQAVKDPISLDAYSINDINLLNPSLWKA